MMNSALRRGIVRWRVPVFALLYLHLAGWARPDIDAADPTVAEADAGIIQARPSVLLDEGNYPRFSRDGSQVLYAKKRALWLASVDGKAKMGWTSLTGVRPHIRCLD